MIALRYGIYARGSGTSPPAPTGPSRWPTNTTTTPCAQHPAGRSPCTIPLHRVLVHWGPGGSANPA